MKKSSWKIPFIKYVKVKYKNNIVKSITPSSFIHPNMINKYYNVYNGKIFNYIFITPSMVTNKIGQYVFTRIKAMYPTKKKKGRGKK